MKDRWNITKQYFGYNNLSEEKKIEVAEKIRAKTIERYKDYRNKRNNIRLCKLLISKILTNEFISSFSSSAKNAARAASSLAFLRA